VYERLTPREQKIADIETAKFIEEGKEIFHSPEKLGGTIRVRWTPMVRQPEPVVKM
jgi:hypothetical protein